MVYQSAQLGRLRPARWPIWLAQQVATAEYRRLPKKSGARVEGAAQSTNERKRVLRVPKKTAQSV
jgi:hypothetical protein